MKRMVQKILILFFSNIMFLLLSVQIADAQNPDAYVFYYFEGYAGEKGGLYASYSYDLHTWHKLGSKLTSPSLGEWEVFRDPSVKRAEDGTYHLVWTCGKSGFGYANSDDGINWENHRFVKVSDADRGFDFVNVWAPELYCEGDTMYVLWSSTLKSDYIPPKDPKKWWNAVWNHRFYYTKTTDFKKFSPAKQFWNAEFNSIDATIHKTDSLYYLFFKDERKKSKNVVMAHSKKLLGPYNEITDVTYRLTEGAIPLQTDTAFVLYYDFYHEYNGYRYKTTKDMKRWSDEIIPEKAGFDDVIRHGSIVPVSEAELQRMKDLL